MVKTLKILPLIFYFFWLLSMPALAAMPSLSPTPLFQIVQPSINEVFPDISGDSTWSDVCKPWLMDIDGVGMGNTQITINPQTLSVANFNNIGTAYLQVVGKRYWSSPIPHSVVIENQTVTVPTHVNDQGYSFETEINPADLLNVTVNEADSQFLTPRAMILYARRPQSAFYSSVGKTGLGYAYTGINRPFDTETLTLPPRNTVKDIDVTVVLADNDVPDRAVTVDVTAGSVTESKTVFLPSHGESLNIMEFNLVGVPTEVQTIEIKMTSSPHSGNEGESIQMVGFNASFECNPNETQLTELTQSILQSLGQPQGNWVSIVGILSDPGINEEGNLFFFVDDNTGQVMVIVETESGIETLTLEELLANEGDPVVVDGLTEQLNNLSYVLVDDANNVRFFTDSTDLAAADITDFFPDTTTIVSATFAVVTLGGLAFVVTTLIRS